MVIIVMQDLAYLELSKAALWTAQNVFDFNNFLGSTSDFVHITRVFKTLEDLELLDYNEKEDHNQGVGKDDQADVSGE